MIHFKKQSRTEFKIINSNEQYSIDNAMKLTEQEINNKANDIITFSIDYIEHLEHFSLTLRYIDKTENKLFTLTLSMTGDHIKTQSFKDFLKNITL